MNQRTALVLVSFVSLVAIAFGAGYASYPLFHPVSEPSASLSEQESVPADPLDLNVYWQAWQILDRDFYGEPPDEQTQIYATLRGLVESFDDPYTYFVEPQPRELERDQLRGSFGGIGAFIEASETGFVLNPMAGQPADLAGIQAGDLLRRVDEVTLTNEMPVDDVVALVRGPVDTAVELTVERAIGDESTGSDTLEERSFSVVRANIETPSVSWEMRADGEGEPVGMIALSLFSERSAEEMRTAVEELRAAGAERFVLDLRGNPGGLVTAAVEIADMWLDEGDILIEEKADGTRKTFRAESGQVADGAPLVVIVDRASASAAEIVAGALQDNGRAQLVGEKTFGKGSVQLIHELTDESSLHITNAEWFTPSGAALTGIGLMPDKIVEEGDDPVVDALEIVRTFEVAKS